MLVRRKMEGAKSHDIPEYHISAVHRRRVATIFSSKFSHASTPFFSSPRSASMAATNKYSVILATYNEHKNLPIIVSWTTASQTETI